MAISVISVQKSMLTFSTTYKLTSHEAHHQMLLNLSFLFIYCPYKFGPTNG